MISKETVFKPTDGRIKFFMVGEPCEPENGVSHLNDFDTTLYTSYKQAESEAKAWLSHCDDVVIMEVHLTAHAVLSGPVKVKKL